MMKLQKWMHFITESKKYPLQGLGLEFRFLKRILKYVMGSLPGHSQLLVLPKAVHGCQEQ
jgi:hypothetical protein